MLAPALSFIPALLLSAVIPFAAPLPLDFDFTLGPLGRFVHHGPMPMVVADLPVGFLFVLAISSLGVYGIALAGLVVEQQVRAARRPPGQRPDDLLRGRDGMSLIPVLLLSRQRQLLAPSCTTSRLGLWYVLPAVPLVLHLPDRGLRRDQPAAVRPARGRVGADRRATTPSTAR